MCNPVVAGEAAAMFGPLLRQAGPFRCLPREHLRRVFAAMQPMDVAAGATIVRPGEPGEHYYLIERGWAEIWRSDPMTDETAPVAVLGPGDPFGEEAMLVGGFHTATITMTTDGRLWTLSKPEFDVLVKPVLVEELDAAQAHVMASNGEAHWLDCRYDIEFEESRIPGAALAPLDRLREHAGVLAKDQTYIVYCRSGRRSACAAYLLRERGIRAYSLAGGIRDWPYAVESAATVAQSAA